MKTYIWTVIVTLLIIGGAYWEYGNVMCSNGATNYVNENKAGKSITDLTTAFNLYYQGCMGHKGL